MLNCILINVFASIVCTQKEKRMRQAVPAAGVLLNQPQTYRNLWPMISYCGLQKSLPLAAANGAKAVEKKYRSG